MLARLHPGPSLSTRGPRDFRIRSTRSVAEKTDLMLLLPSMLLGLGGLVAAVSVEHQSLLELAHAARQAVEAHESLRLSWPIQHAKLPHAVLPRFRAQD